VPAAAIWKQGATFVDVNNDGLLDLYVCRYNAPNLLYINQGDGTFREMARDFGLDVTDSSVMAAFCDYDRDGWLDVYITTNLLDHASHPGGQRGRLLHNNRDGTFTEVTDRAGIRGEGQGHSATWWDYDNDGWPDLYVGHDYGVPDQLYHNNRDGTFTDVLRPGPAPYLVFHMGCGPGRRGQRRAHRLPRGRHGRDDPRDRPALPRRRPRQDPRAGGRRWHSAPKYHRNSPFLLNTGRGRCLEAASLAGIAATDWTWSVRFEDLDNDGRLDLFATNGFPWSPGVDLIRRLMNARRLQGRADQDHVREPVQSEAKLRLPEPGRAPVRGCERGLGPRPGRASALAPPSATWAATATLAWSTPTTTTASASFRNDCDTGHRVIVELRGTVSNRFGIGSTVRLESASGVQVRPLVLARGYLSSSEPVAHFGLGDDTQSYGALSCSGPAGTFRHSKTSASTGASPSPSPQGPSPGARKPVQSPGQFAEVSQTVGLAIMSREESVDETGAQRLIPLRLNRRGPGLAVGGLGADGRNRCHHRRDEPGPTADPSGANPASSPHEVSGSSPPRKRPTTALSSFSTPTATATATSW
jgi:hypothetical protein